MDPIGMVRRENHGVFQYSIWLRMDPGYPDNQLTDTEWTCIWSTSEGNIGTRLGAGAVERTDHPIIGTIDGTPAATGEDVAIGDRVETRPDAIAWASGESLQGQIADIKRDVSGAWFTILFDEPQVITGEVDTQYSRWAVRRQHFVLLEED
jgi:hypothetical protein